MLRSLTWKSNTVLPTGNYESNTLHQSLIRWHFHFAFDLFFIVILSYNYWCCSMFTSDTNNLQMTNLPINQCICKNESKNNSKHKRSRLRLRSLHIKGKKLISKLNCQTIKNHVANTNLYTMCMETVNRTLCVQCGQISLFYRPGSVLPAFFLFDSVYCTSHRQLQSNDDINYETRYGWNLEESPYFL